MSQVGTEKQKGTLAIKKPNQNKTKLEFVCPMLKIEQEIKYIQAK